MMINAAEATMTSGSELEKSEWVIKLNYLYELILL
jgi:hypothetical protein